MVSMYLIKHHTMKKYGRVEVYLHKSLFLALEGGDWSASRPNHFTSGKQSPVTLG